MPYMYKATGLISDFFKKNDIRFHIHQSKRGVEGVVVPVLAGEAFFPVPLWFLSRDDKNSVAARIFGLIKAPSDRIHQLMMVCNTLNGKRRFVKYNIDPGGDLDMQFDFPAFISDENVGIVALETKERFEELIKIDYFYFKTALETDEDVQSLIESEPDFRASEPVGEHLN